MPRGEHLLGAARGTLDASKTQAKHSTIGQFVDDAMTGIERDNPTTQERVAQGLGPAGARQDATRPAH